MNRPWPASVVLTVLAAGGASSASAAVDRGALEKHIDELVLVEKKVPPHGPGCALAVVLDGDIVFEKGYGVADVQAGTPLTPATAFNIGSMSKQFTAAGIVLLAQEGRLSLDDDVRKYVRELPDYGPAITLRHLIHHTSGISSDDGLIALSGRRFSDSFTTADVLGFIVRRRSLDFVPGAEHAYSNSNYILLGEVVARVSGRSLAGFLQERIFGPLGMTRTVLNDSPARPIENEAVSYTRTKDGGWAPTNERRNTCVGSNNVYSTVHDLALWGRNFEDQKVGGPGFTEQMQTRGVLNSGERLSYAFGLEVARSRGQLTVSHGGTTTGFRSQMMRLPLYRFSAVCLCNSDQGAPVSSVWKTAGFVLGDLLGNTDAAGQPGAAAPQPEVRPGPAILSRYLGKFQLEDGSVITTTLDNGVLKGRVTGQDPFGLVAETQSRFHLDGAPELKVDFEGPVHGPAEVLVLRQDGVKRLKRIEDRLLTTAELGAFAGDYYSVDLDVSYQVRLAGDRLFIHTPIVEPVYRQDWGITGDDPLVYDGGDTFALGEMPVPTRMPVAFKRDAAGRPVAFKLDAGRVRTLTFVRR